MIVLPTRYYCNRFPCHNECNRKGWVLCLASLFAATYATVSLSSSNESDALPGSFAEEQMTLCFCLLIPRNPAAMPGTYVYEPFARSIRPLSMPVKKRTNLPTWEILHGGRVVEKPPLSARPDWSRLWRWRCETWAFSLQADKGRYIVKSALTKLLSRSAIGGERRKCYPLHSFYSLSLTFGPLR